MASERLSAPSPGDVRSVGARHAVPSPSAFAVSPRGQGTPGASSCHDRRSHRLPGYDYRTPGAYFVTICTSHRRCLFGEIAHDEMHLSWQGQIVAECWDDLPNHFGHVQLGAFVVMPNHVHGIIILAAAEEGTASRAPTTTSVELAIPADTDAGEAFGRPVAGSIPTIVRSFKAGASRRVNEAAIGPRSALWQANYDEHVIRDEAGFDRIRAYIATNAERWSLDGENPLRKGRDEFDRWLSSVSPGGAQPPGPDLVSQGHSHG